MVNGRGEKERRREGENERRREGRLRESKRKHHQGKQKSAIVVDILNHSIYLQGKIDRAYGSLQILF